MVELVLASFLLHLNAFRGSDALYLIRLLWALLKSFVWQAYSFFAAQQAIFYIFVAYHVVVAYLFYLNSMHLSLVI